MFRFSLIIFIFFLTTNLKAETDQKTCDQIFNLLNNVPYQVRSDGWYMLDHESIPLEKKYGYVPEYKIEDKGQLIGDVQFFSAFYDYGVKAGDYIQAINGENISRESLYEYAVQNNVIPKKSIYGFLYDIEKPFFETNNQGIILNEVLENSSAWDAGFRKGDIIKSINDILFFDKENFGKFNYGKYNSLYTGTPSDLFVDAQDLFRNSDYESEFYNLSINFISKETNEEKTIKISPKIIEMPLMNLDDYDLLENVLSYIYNSDKSYDDFVIYSSEKQSADTQRIYKKDFKYPIDVSYELDHEIKKIDIKENTLLLDAEIFYKYKDPVIADYLNDFIKVDAICEIDREDFNTNYPIFPTLKIFNITDQKFKRNDIKISFFPPYVEIKDKQAEEDEAYYYYGSDNLDDIKILQEFAIASDELQDEFINSLDSNDELYEEGRSEKELDSLLQERIFKYTETKSFKELVKYAFPAAQYEYTYYDYPTYNMQTHQYFDANIELGKLSFKDFPFDKHEIEIRFYHLFKDLYYFRDDYIESNSKLTFKLTEWDVNAIPITKENYKYNDYYYEEILYNFEIKRNYGYYLIKVIAPMILILIVCWSVFWINAIQIESRLTISVVCLLALIAYNFVFADTLPKLGYATILDYLILSSYFMGALATLLTIVLYKLEISGKYIHSKNNIELISKYGLPILYIIIVNVTIGQQINNQLYQAVMALFTGN
tara:strand:+ start:4211 stop:6358 length:2148 start_codon:yes stop_codon:yes gene_type:complete